jgi:hypothetical protein
MLDLDADRANVELRVETHNRLGIAGVVIALVSA